MNDGGHRWYQAHAKEAADRYESIEPAHLHRWIDKVLPDGELYRVLDIGAGSGRDAAWLARQGHDVIAVEPSQAMLQEAKRRHPDSTSTVTWVKGKLPKLPQSVRNEKFSLILLSAVWMHIPQKQRRRAFRKLIGLLEQEGVLVLTLRDGPEDPERCIYPVSESEIEELARDHGAIICYRQEEADVLGRKNIRWIQLAIRFPEDGTGELALIRHIILKQSKSATHKLGLLRTLCRVADSVGGMAHYHNSKNTVSVPMGLVALTWLRLYKPLLEEGLPQLPTKSGELEKPGFAKDAFRKLRSVSHLDLRVGMQFSGDTAKALHQALKDARDNIVRMPVHYMTYPNGGQILSFQRTASRYRPPEHLKLSEAYLSTFGEMHIPKDLWQLLRTHAIWVEPVIVAEWAEMMVGYATPGHESAGELEARIKNAMLWPDPERGVQQPRERALKLLEEEGLICVWSKKPLRQGSLDIDHCLPWSVWSCGDLWNLMPAHRQVNQHQKRDMLPSDSTLEQAEERILNWWERAYLDDSLQEKFFLEAASSLPGIHGEARNLEEIFESVCLQREKLKRDQQAPEWVIQQV